MRTEIEIIDSEEFVEKIVPISKAEAMGVEFLENKKMLLEFGFAKKIEDGKLNIIIDVRKEISAQMVEDLYEQLKVHFKDKK